MYQQLPPSAKFYAMGEKFYAHHLIQSSEQLSDAGISSLETEFLNQGIHEVFDLLFNFLWLYMYQLGRVFKALMR